MADNVSKLRIFLSSPNELRDEYGSLRTVIDELNKSSIRDKKIVLELQHWKTDTWPGVGLDAQDVINQELIPEDIYVGVLWKRLGSPTPRSASGTVEEFENAFKRYKSTGEPQILFYFRTEPFFPSDLRQVEEVTGVLSFRKRLQQEGVLYWQYTTVVEFERLIRQHLSLALSRLQLPPAPPAPEDDIGLSLQRVDDLKMLMESLPLLKAVPVSLIYADLDEFKRLNNQLGFAEADALLDRIRGIFLQRIGEKGTLYSVGGDEFVVVMPNTRLREARRLAEELRLATRSAARGHSRVTCSFGVAATKEPNLDVLRAVHTAVFVSKIRGGDNITPYPLSPDDRATFELAVSRGIS
jgi:diguanylate cyclase (GGDEF)-like protein